MKLYYSPGACSLACHIALEESSLPYETVEVNTARGENQTDAYRRINPLGVVPALEIRGEILTEGPAILSLIADLVPQRRLLPEPGTLERARAQEWLNFLSSTVHIAFRSIFRPERLGGADSAVIEAIRSKGQERVAEVLAIVEDRLGDRPFALGKDFSLCDAYLLVYYRWSRRANVAPYLPSLRRLAAVAAQTAERGSVQRVLESEGIGLEP